MPRWVYNLTKFFLIYFAFFLAIGFTTLIYLGLKKSQPLFFILALANIYLLPPLTQRFFNALYPMKQGATLVDPNEYHPWINSFRMQKIFMIFPQLERMLFLIPGLYNAWLRLWGSKIGKGVYILPGVEIVDRGNVHFEDFVFIGNKTYISPHVAMTKNGKMYIYIKDIKISKGTFIGAFCTLGPGTNIPAGQIIPAGSYYTINSTQPDGTRKA